MKFDKENLVNFPAQLIKVETVKLVAEKYADITDKEFNIDVDTDSEIIDEFNAKSIIKIKISNDTYLLEVEKVGVYKFEQSINSIEQVKLFLEVQGIRILWSYLREDIYSISSKMLPSPIMLPTIDVLKTLEKAK